MHAIRARSWNHLNKVAPHECLRRLDARGLLHDEPGEDFVRAGDWNTYEILAVGERVRTAVNGHPCVDLTDPDGAREGVIALQMHSGAPFEVRFRALELQLDPGRDAQLRTVLE